MKKMNIRGSIHDTAQIKTSSAFKPASTFCFHGDKSRLSALKCLQQLHLEQNVVSYVEISILQ